MQSQEKSNLMDRSPTTRLHLAAQAVGNEGLALAAILAILAAVTYVAPLAAFFIGNVIYGF